MSKFSDNIKTWHVIIGIIVILAGVSIGISRFLYAFDQKKADKIEVVMLSNQLRAYTIDQERASIQRQIYEIEDRFHCGPRYGSSCFMVIKDQTIKNSLLNLQQQLKKKQEELKRIYKK